VLPPDALERLTMALTLVFGLEAMITTRDVCGLEQATPPTDGVGGTGIGSAARAEAGDR